MTVDLKADGDIAVLTLNRPAALNALSFSMLDEIADAIDTAAGMAVRALILTGAGERAFCAGADIPELRKRDLRAQRRGIEKGQAVFSKIPLLPFGSVALINGYAFGGGLEMALACTFRLGTPNAKMGLPEIKLGLIPGYGGTQRLPRLVGEARALEMILTGRTVDAPEALSIGLLNRIVEGDPVAAARAFVEEFARYSLPVSMLAREAITRALDLPVHEGLRTEADLATLAFRTEDAEEGMAAFVEKRRPEFRDG